MSHLAGFVHPEHVLAGSPPAHTLTPIDHLDTVKILITGVAGFIGMHVAIRLLARGDEVVGVDNLNEYYDPGLKRARLELLNSHPRFCFLQFGLEEREPCASLFARERPQRVVHLAAQAGVRHSISHPHAYSDANLTAFVNLLEGCRQSRVDHLVFASSSSVYGDRDQAPPDQSLRGDQEGQ
jgi:UDP-glucuronate 4-epimerase